MATFRGYYTGGKRDCPDHRDRRKRYGGHDIPSTDAHPTVDLRYYIDHVYEQGSLHNCTANALCSAFKMSLVKQSMEMNIPYNNFEPSRLFVYYNSRMYTDRVNDDTAVTVRDTFKTLYNEGVCQESLWPYDIQKFAWKPSPDVYRAALDNKVLRYERVDQEIDQIRACLKAGFPFVFMFELYNSFFSQENTDKGLMPLPSDAEIQSNQPGFHTVLAVGYDDRTQLITVLNSWGESFGDNGYFYMPYKYILDEDRTGCLWVIEEVCEKDLDSGNQIP